MVALNTLHSTYPSFYTNTGIASRTDYIAVPLYAQLSGVAGRAIVWRRSGDRLQLVKTRTRIDHHPLAFPLSTFTLEYDDGPPPQRWDRDLLAEAVIKGTKRHDFSHFCSGNANLWKNTGTPQTLSIHPAPCITSYALQSTALGWRCFTKASLKPKLEYKLC